MATLPRDSEVEGNVWCAACQQSLLASRAAAHLASKKHVGKTFLADDAPPARKAKPAPAAPAAVKTKSSRKAPVDDSGSEDDEGRAAEEKPARRAPATAEKKVAAARVPKGGGHGLPRDPEREGNFYCGICKVSLTPAKADEHAQTARHQANAERTLTGAMRKLRVADE